MANFMKQTDEIKWLLKMAKLEEEFGFPDCTTGSPVEYLLGKSVDETSRKQFEIISVISDKPQND